MRLVRFRAPDERVWAGTVEGDHVTVALPGDGHAGRGALIDLAMAQRHREGAVLKQGPSYALDEVRILPPVPEPPSIRDFYAFEEHVATARKMRGLEMDPDWYELPVFYFTNPHVVYGHGDEVPMPRESAAVDYELEVAAVVGRDASNVSAEEAAGMIAGYTIFNDFSARDLQVREMAQSLGPAKGKDFANAFGPVLVTPDELPGGPEGRPRGTMTARVNGTEYSRGELGDCHWSFADMIAYAARDSRVRRGDLIGSGTVGTGCILERQITDGADRFPWLEPGDTVELEVQGIGILRNTVSG